jgi:hypothetical protein
MTRLAGDVQVSIVSDALFMGRMALTAIRRLLIGMSISVGPRMTGHAIQSGMARARQLGSIHNGHRLGHVISGTMTRQTKVAIPLHSVRVTFRTG